MDRAIGSAKRARPVEYSLTPSYRLRLTSCAEPGDGLTPELLTRPRIPRAAKVPEFSLYPISRASTRPAAPGFISVQPEEMTPWSSICRELELSSAPGERGSESEHESEQSSAYVASEADLAERTEPSRLERLKAYLAQPRGAANALGIGAAAGVVVASFLLFACK